MQRKPGRPRLSVVRERVVTFVMPDTAGWVRANGGSSFAAGLIEDAHKAYIEATMARLEASHKTRLQKGQNRE